MYFKWLHKKTPGNSSIDVLKKSFLGRFRVLGYVATNRNDLIYLFPRALEKNYISIHLCILIDYTRKLTIIAVSMSTKKVFWVGYWFSNIFRLLETTEFFFFLGLFKRIISESTYVFSMIIQENTRKMQYRCTQKKFFGSVSSSQKFYDYSKRQNLSFPRAL